MPTLPLMLAPSSLLLIHFLLTRAPHASGYTVEDAVVGCRGALVRGRGIVEDPLNAKRPGIIRTIGYNNIERNTSGVLPLAYGDAIRYIPVHYMNPISCNLMYNRCCHPLVVS